MATIRVTGARKLRRTLARLDGNARKALARGLFQEGEAIKAVGVPITPIEFGPLRGSWIVLPPVETSRGPEVEIGVGGASAPYAVFVHERTELRHRPPTQAKFLETPLQERSRGMAGRLARRVRLALMGR